LPLPGKRKMADSSNQLRHKGEEVRVRVQCSIHSEVFIFAVLEIKSPPSVRTEQALFH
jgi:hypothetical protein